MNWETCNVYISIDDDDEVKINYANPSISLTAARRRRSRTILTTSSETRTRDVAAPAEAFPVRRCFLVTISRRRRCTRWRDLTYMARTTSRTKMPTPRATVTTITGIVTSTAAQSTLVLTKRWHVTISCQLDGRPPQPVRPWKSGRVGLHFSEGSNVVVLKLPYILQISGGKAKRLRVGSENMENLVTFWPTL